MLFALLELRIKTLDEGVSMEDFKIITEVPERLEGKRALALKWLIQAADRVSVLEKPKGRSIYKFYFDEGAFKGGTEFTLKQVNLTPLTAYLLTANIVGWPGFKNNLTKLEDYATWIMEKEIEVKETKAI